MKIVKLTAVFIRREHGSPVETVEVAGRNKSDCQKTARKIAHEQGWRFSHFLGES